MAESYHYWICRCGAKQAMTEETRRVLLHSSGTFYCVHGHGSHWPQGPSQEDRLRAELEAERLTRQRLEQRCAQKDDEITYQRNRANGYKGHATRITKRAKAGVCPCCNRTFKQLAAHMANKHPEFTPIELEQGVSLQ